MAAGRHKFDLPDTRLIELLPLKESFVQNDIEDELRNLTLDLFNEKLADLTFDVNVAGNAHLGSFDLVRKSITFDGLTLLRGDREECAARYVYRAWKSGDVQGRGLHFIRTYLQTLFPNLTKVTQLWHKKDVEYPNGLESPLDGPDVVIDPETMF